MSNHASATLVGRLGRNPETRTTQGGKDITTFSLAASTGFGNNKKTTWWNIVCFGKIGDVAAKYLLKGNVAMVLGEPCLREWEDKDGAKRASIELVASQLVLIGSNENEPKADASPASRSAPKKLSEDAPFDDEIPF